MCLSSVYKMQDGVSNLICDYVQLAQVEDNGVKIVDLSGNETLIPGTIRTIDLMRNTITIEEM